MSIESFFTVHVVNAGTGKGSSNGLALPGAMEGKSFDGLAFLDFILQNITQSKENSGDEPETETASSPHAPLQSENPLLNKEAGIDLSAILAETPEIREAMKNSQSSDLDKIEETLLLNKIALDDLLKALPEDPGELDLIEIVKKTQEAEEQSKENPTVFDLLFASNDTDITDVRDQIKAILEKIGRTPRNLDTAPPSTDGEHASSGDVQDNSKPFLVVSNLTPAQIEALQEYSASEGKSEWPEDVPPITLFAFIPPRSEAAPKHAQDVVHVRTNQGQSGESSDLASRMNALNIGEESPFDTTDTRAGKDSIKGNAKEADAASSGKNTDEKADTAAPRNDNAPAGNRVQGSTAMASYINAGDNLTLIGSETEASLIAVATQGSPLSSSGGSLTSPVLHAQHAASAHPGTQMVAATLKRSAASGKEQNITLQLDPPELGRLEVQMNFGKDKTLKTKIIVEKADTMVMLQRDAHALERALQDSGLEADSGLSFELAEDGHDFFGGNKRGGGHDHGGGHGSGDKAGSGEDVMIHSTMTWSVDPDTGHVSYDILA